ncbi:MCE family protein [Pimelobacter simplex]|uniref:MCE-family protein MceC n=1 Tax=Nocardioides simplex TaxID=2045 RepID=A0A0A1DI36_NOCSI|nr:MCE family protein [Pimelobacter simplex]AIY16213.1 MCE-family protein MceC [Pimelobacter simplex]MCG8151296.1 MCE family protein [Pimelobacter simplex]GEB12153.1 ABC transporter substrate-binding protein [Pimelobacter simplex]SFN17324.1 phospholipid/cholesterol/gamma-HCH transport system substrate-binding protein [Pimelobacter simplex]
MKPFRERNPVVVGAVSIAVLVLGLVAALRAQDLPLIGGGDTYYASFSEAGGLKVKDEVRIAGVRVGQVTSMDLDGNSVKVGFKIKPDTPFGDETRADIKVKTILGSMFLSLEPAGSGQLAEGTTIPVERTSSPYDVVDAFTGLAETSADIDTDQLAASLTTLADLTRNTPEDFRKALSGLSALADTVASRDKEIGSLLQNLHRVSTVLDSRDDDIVALMADADTLFQALLQRKEQIHRLLVSTSTLSTKLTGLIRESRADLKPALDHLDSVLQVIKKNENNLEDSIATMAPFYRVFASTLGNGPWFDTYIFNLPPLPGTVKVG